MLRKFYNNIENKIRFVKRKFKSDQVLRFKKLFRHSLFFVGLIKGSPLISISTSSFDSQIPLPLSCKYTIQLQQSCPGYSAHPR